MSGTNLSLSTDLNIITAEIKLLETGMAKSMTEHAWEIGRRLIHAKESVGHGNFGNWIEKNFEFSWQYANQFMRYHIDNPNLNSRFNLPTWKHVTEVMSLPESVDRQEFIESAHVIPSTGESKLPEDMTVKELREVKKAKKLAEERAEQAEAENAKLQKKLEKVITEDQKDEFKAAVIEEYQAEIAPQFAEKDKQIKQLSAKYVLAVNQNSEQQDKLLTQIDNLKKNKPDSPETIKRLKDYEAKLKKVTDDKAELDKRLKDQQKAIGQVEEIQNQIKDLNTQKDDISRQMDSAVTLARLSVQIEDMLKNQLAPIRYSRALMERRDSKAAMQNLDEIISTVEHWCSEIRGLMPNNYVEVEVIR